jgi:hypothetical protein
MAFLAGGMDRAADATGLRQSHGSRRRSWSGSSGIRQDLAPVPSNSAARWALSDKERQAEEDGLLSASFQSRALAEMGDFLGTAIKLDGQQVAPVLYEQMRHHIGLPDAPGTSSPSAGMPEPPLSPGAAQAFAKAKGMASEVLFHEVEAAPGPSSGGQLAQARSWIQTEARLALNLHPEPAGVDLESKGPE